MTTKGETLYPLKFQPMLKPVIWGGSAISRFKNIQPVQEGIGESWEVSGMKGEASVVSNGYLKGKSLEELIIEHQGSLLGESIHKRFGETFPLLIKLIDAQEALSIQVHPDDKLAKERHDSFGKTEMWYVIRATPGAYLYSGFKHSITPEEYVEKVNDNTLTDALQRYEVKKGDVFFLPAGRVHAIGAGCFMAEIQQTSNITYRIFDYNRKDAAGKNRELHTDLAKDAIDFRVYNSYQTHYIRGMNQSVELVTSPFFTTSLLELDESITCDYRNIDSFIVYICVKGSATLKDDRGYTVEATRGESILIPANRQWMEIMPDGHCTLLETRP